MIFLDISCSLKNVLVPPFLDVCLLYVIPVCFIYNLPRIAEVEVVQNYQGAGLFLQMVGDHVDSVILEEIKRYNNNSEISAKQDVYHLRPTELRWAAQIIQKQKQKYFLKWSTFKHFGEIVGLNVVLYSAMNILYLLVFYCWYIWKCCHA